MSNRQTTAVVLLAVAFLVYGMFSYPDPESAQSESSDRPLTHLEKLQAAMPGTPLDTAMESVIPGLIEVTAGERVLYLDKTGRYLVVGSIYDLQKARDLTADRQQQLSQGKLNEQVAKALPSFEQMEALSVHYGSSDPDLPLLIIFSDPQCSYCQRLHEELVDRTDLRVMEMMYPIFPGSQELAATILCSENPLTALGLAMQSQPLSSVDEACLSNTRADLSLSLALGREWNVQGTPMLLTKTEGQWRRHDGYLSTSALLNWLKESP